MCNLGLGEVFDCFAEESVVSSAAAIVYVS
jgi:hypothetical protein